VTDDATAALRTAADYQFGAGAGAALFPPDEPLEVRRSTGGRPRQVHTTGPEPRRLVSYRVDGRFTLGLAGGRRLAAAFSPPTARVAVGTESVPHVRAGRNAFAKFVRAVDPAVRPGDELLVAGPDGDLLAVGRAELAAVEMHDFDVGVAVAVREGADD